MTNTALIIAALKAAHEQHRSESGQRLRQTVEYAADPAACQRLQDLSRWHYDRSEACRKLADSIEHTGRIPA